MSKLSVLAAIFVAVLCHINALNGIIMQFFVLWKNGVYLKSKTQKSRFFFFFFLTIPNLGIILLLMYLVGGKLGRLNYSKLNFFCTFVYYYVVFKVRYEKL